MSAVGDDAVRIPIEIKTEDIEEIDEIVQKLKEAKSDARTAVPTTKAKAELGESRAPSRIEAFESRGGIFGGEVGGGGGALRDKASRAPLQRQNQLTKLQQDVKGLETQASGNAEAVDLLTAGFFGTSVGVGAGGAARAGIGGAKNVLKGGMGGGMIGVIAKFAAPIGIALLAAGLIKNIIDELVKPGGPFDRRFRRNVQQEIAKLTSLKEKAEIAQGKRTFRVTTIAGLTGESTQVRSNLDYIKNGILIYDIDGQLNKGIGAGTI